MDRVFSKQIMLTQEQKIIALKEALRYSPIGVAVFAWQFDFDKKVYIRPKGAEDNHFVVLFGYADGLYFQIFDSYDSTIKHLDWNFGFERCLRYRIEKIEHTNFWQIIKNYFKNLFA